MIQATCAPIATGSGFLKSSLAYFDCAGQSIGSGGYAALTAQGSVIQTLLLAAVTLFIAWQGLRMMFGHVPAMGDAVLAVAKIGLVIMLVVSWPAVQTLVAGPALQGPAELTSQAGFGGSRQIEDRLQKVDDGIVALTAWGTGKLDIRAGRTAEGQPAATAFTGVALTDSLALGLGRLAYLTSALVGLGLIRLLGGAMVAALPLFAGLFLFDATRGIFLGCARLMFGLLVAGLAVPMLLTVELSLLEPWLSKVIEQRSNLFATPSAPTELLAMTGAFGLIIIGSMALIVRACLAINVASVIQQVQNRAAACAEPSARQAAPNFDRTDRQLAGLTRAEMLAQTISRIEHRSPAGTTPTLATASAAAPSERFAAAGGRGGASRQRVRQRVSLSQAKRDQS